MNGVEQSWRDLFGDAEVIYTYSDAEALRDGVLVDYGRDGYGMDRTTGAVWHRYTEGLNDVPQHDTGELDRVWKCALSCPEDEGWRVYEDQTSGETLWLIPNEVGGLTLMFPRDY